ncbi:UDP-N-acetylglucosamine 2-epimerase [Anaerovibrio lipolyticus]|uniref:UDP-N-acetylglucosamine 2-epimerase n=1 Tax=Anaerovibrio lipolyticus TaxID=82374 RepID=UPI0026EE394D|nr:UDP-N-acetylglucosamine 2-epimerase [Anaerovibrio lipolyticus]MBE6106501.1 UDP-N-acetylglucosamine 2-epimerase (hydrolyzing) [Anaerovibrio lipolyticus]
MKKIAVVTATRAEYGLLSPVIKKLRAFASELFRVELIVTGTHLSEQYGMTVGEIDDHIDYKLPISVKSFSKADISANQAETLIKFTDLFLIEKYNGVVILGDRYEMLAIAIAAGNTHTPIFHLCGGDTTEGALDEWIRHSITKMSYLHFVTNNESYNRVIQLGEAPERVFNYGSTSIDNILHVANLTKTEALQSIGLDDCKYALCTYHPVTMEDGCVDEQIEYFLTAIKSFPKLQFILTKSNADQGGARINELLDEAEKEMDNLHVFTSLGVRRYLSLMKYSEFVIGNSSSGIIETPTFHVPTVNIGDRQRGRLQSESIINCGEDTDSIVMAINKALNVDFKEVCNSVVSPYGDGHAAEKIAKKIYEVVGSDMIDLKKKFFDIEAKL